MKEKFPSLVSRMFGFAKEIAAESGVENAIRYGTKNTWTLAKHYGENIKDILRNSPTIVSLRFLESLADEGNTDPYVCTEANGLELAQIGDKINEGIKNSFAEKYSALLNRIQDRRQVVLFAIKHSAAPYQ